MTRKLTTPRGVALVALATLIALWPALRAAFVWDDALLIEHNRYLLGPGAVTRALTHGFWDVEVTGAADARYYRPAVTLLFVALRAVFGLHPAGYHAALIALHLAAVVLVGVLLHRTLGDDPPAVTAGTALFALHATRAESVVWISGATDVLTALPVLAALIAALPPRDAPAPRPARVALVALFTALALLGKETALTLPPALFALCLATWPAGAPRRRALALFTGASLTVALAYVAARTAVYPLPASPASPPPGRHAALALETVGWYARLIAWPWPLSLIRVPIQVQGDVRVVSPVYVVLGALSVLAVALAYRARATRPLGAGLAIAVAFVFPVLNVRWLGLVWLVAEHYLYLPFIGLALALGAAVASARPATRRAVLAVGGVVALAHAGSIWARALDYRDAKTFWDAEASMHPDVPAVLVGQATGALETGHPGRAFVYLRRAFETASRYEAGPRLGYQMLSGFDAALLVVPDDDRASLESALGFFRALRDPRVRSPRAVVLGRTFEYPKGSLGPVPDDALPGLRSIEATVLSRLGRLDEARAAAVEALGMCHARCGEVALNAALVCARARDWECALGANARAARESDDAAKVARQRGQLLTVRAHADEAARATSDEQRALAEAEVDLFLARPEAARAELLRAGESVRAELLRVRVELLEYHFGAADERIARLRAGAPERAQRVFAELGALEARQHARVEGL